MTDYLDFDIEDDPDVLFQLAVQEMQSRIPGWDPIVGEIDTALLQSAARIAAQVRASAGIVPVGIFRYLAAQFGVQPAVAQAATALANIGYVDGTVHLLPAGTLFAVTNDAGELRTFITTADAINTFGTWGVDNVPIQSTIPGTYDNGITAGAGLAPIDALPFISSTSGALLTTASAGGLDADTDAEYMAKLVRRYQLQSAAPILPGDFAALALDVLPAGARTIAIDGWSEFFGTAGNSRQVTVFAIDVNGNAFSLGTRNNVVDYLNTLREVNWGNECASPAFFQMSVKFTAHAIPGWDPAAVQADGIAAITNYLSPQNWGWPALESLTNWTLLEGWDKVRLGELYQVLNGVEGIAYVDTLFLKAGAVAPTVEIADVTLTGGQVVLPTPGSITGTVT